MLPDEPSPEYVEEEANLESLVAELFAEKKLKRATEAVSVRLDEWAEANSFTPWENGCTHGCGRAQWEHTRRYGECPVCGLATVGRAFKCSGCGGDMCYACKLYMECETFVERETY